MAFPVRMPLFGLLGARSAARLGSLVVLVRDEPDGPFRRVRWHRQRANRFKHFAQLVARIAAEGAVRQLQRLGLALQFIQPLGQIPVRDRQFAHSHEGTHDLDIDRHRALAVEHRREHRHSLLGERVGCGAPAAAARAGRV